MKRIALLFLISSFAISTICLAKGRQLPNGVVIQDYYSPINIDYLNKVTAAHVNKTKKRYIEHKYQWVLEDINYTLYRVPNHPESLQMLSNFSFDKNQKLTSPLKATKLFKKAIEYTPKQPITYILFGIHLHKMKKYKQAIEQYKMAITYDPSNIEAHYNIGLSYFEIKNYEKARFHAQIAYDKKFPLNGLKNKLIKAKHWL